MTISWPQPVVNSIARRRSVILIGSGTSANATSAAGQRPPTWGQFLKEAHSGLGRSIKHIASALSSKNYLEACDYLKTEYNAGWADLIREKFVQPNFRPAEIHKRIFDLDSRIVMSLNFDKIYESHAIPASENTVIVKNYYDLDVRQAVAGTDRYILKPHGTVDTISRMIFTTEEYAKARVEHASFYELINSLLHTHTFICIGCGLSDPDFRILFEDYRFKFSESPHYMCIPAPISDPECDLIRKTRGLNVLKYSARDNHAELTQSLANLVAQVNDVRENIARELNW